MVDRLANYEPVQARIVRFWADHQLGRIAVELVERDDTHVLAKASIWRDQADTHPATEGWAQEVHDGSPVNRQGWMIENAETSAIGRALANLGYSGQSGTRPTNEDMGRAEGRSRQQIADAALAQVTFDRLKLIEPNTPEADALKEFAAGRSLSRTTLTADPTWRALVDEHLNERASHVAET